MSVGESQAASPPPKRPWFQFGLRTLFLPFVLLASSLVVFGAWGVVVFVLTMGLAVACRRARSLSSMRFKAFATVWLSCFVVVVFLAFYAARREYNRCEACRNNLSQVMLGLRNYQSVCNGWLPRASTVHPFGKTIRSWRFSILPCMGTEYPKYETVYKLLFSRTPREYAEFLGLSAISVPEYRCPGEPSREIEGATQASYLAVSGRNAAWQGDEPRKLADFGDEAAHSVMLIEVPNTGIAWPEPREFSLDTLNVTDSRSPPTLLASHHSEDSRFFFTYDSGVGVHVAMADGSVHFLRTDNLTPDELQKVLATGGCKNVAGGPRVCLDEAVPRVNLLNIAALAAWLTSVGTLLTAAVRSRKPPAEPPTLRPFGHALRGCARRRSIG